MLLIGLLLFWALMLAIVLSLQRHRGLAVARSGDCPRCHANLQPLSAGIHVQPPRSWSAFACPSCSIALVTVQGVIGRAAWCPKCNHRALEVTIHRDSDSRSERGECLVEEVCHLCGHDAEIPVNSQRPKGNGQVIPFPGKR